MALDALDATMSPQSFKFGRALADAMNGTRQRTPA